MFITKIIKSQLPNINDYISENTSVIASAPNSHEGYIVPELITTHVKGGMKVNDLAAMLPKLLPTIKEAKNSYRTLKNNPNLNKKTISDTILEELKEYSYTIGVSDIAFTKVSPTMIFKDRKILFDNAIVFTMEMKRESIDTAPSKKAKIEIFRTYLGLGIVVNKIAKFLREKGFNAQAGPALGGDVNYSLLAQKAGLGVIGKHGLLISPQFGPSFRIAAVYTDIENLPFNTTNNHMWVNSFCDKCNRCVKKCPSGAIYKETKIFDDGSKECIDYKKCAVPFANHYGCTVCVKECVFYKNDYNKIKEGFD